MVNGITFSEQLITSANFAHFMHTFLNHANGVTKGCEISHANGNIYVQKGYFVEFGRMVQVIGVEEIPSPDVLSGQLYCEVVFEIDLSKVNTVEEFKQGYFKTLTGTEGYPELTQQDLDTDGTLYQMPWCQYVKKTDGISEFRDLRDILDLKSIWSAISDQNTEYKAEFDEYFADQRSEVERLIQELHDEGYVRIEDARNVYELSLPASAWSGEAPYTQTIQLEGVTVEDSLEIGILLTDDGDAASRKAKRKAWGFVDRAVTGEGTVTFYCYDKKPAADIVVLAKGVIG